MQYTYTICSNIMTSSQSTPTITIMDANQTHLDSYVNVLFNNADNIMQDNQLNISNNNQHPFKTNYMPSNVYTSLQPPPNYAVQQAPSSHAQLYSQVINTHTPTDIQELRDLLNSWSLGHCFHFFQRTY